MLVAWKPTHSFGCHVSLGLSVSQKWLPANDNKASVLFLGSLILVLLSNPITMLLPSALQITSLLIIIFSLLFHLLKSFNRWWYLPHLAPSQLPLPPGDLGWPIFGNMLQFLRDFKSGNPQAFVARYTKKYKCSGVYKAFMFGQPSILATTVEACKLVLMNDDLFTTGWPKSASTLMGPKSFTSLSKEEHYRLRKLTAASLNGQEALRKYIKRMDRLAKQTLEDCADKFEVSFLYELKKYTFNIIVDIFLSYTPGSKTKELEHKYREINEGIRAMPLNFPGTSYNRALKSRARLVALLQDAIHERRRNEDSRHEDILEALMSVVDEKGNHLTDEEIIDVLIMYLNAGHESSAHTMMWIIIFLNRNPDILESVKEEQEKIFQQKKSKEALLTLEDWRSMNYLAKVIDETLRLVNVSPMVFRKALCDVEFNGYTIPKGWNVQVWLREVHLDDRVHEEAGKFNPNRWNNCTTRPCTFIPFGAGSRLCPGNELAKLEMSVLMHYLIVHYKIEILNLDSPIVYLPHPRPKDNLHARIYRQ